MGEESCFASADTLVAFRQRVGVQVERMPLPVGFETLIRFYQECRAADALPVEEGGDMLLFQWGTYDWGQGESFEINLTRQIIFPADEADNVSGDDDPEIWQLRLTYYFSPQDALRTLGEGNQWCERPNDLPSFRATVLSSPHVALAAKYDSKHVELLWESAE
jgi:hypothetical protein